MSRVISNISVNQSNSPRNVIINQIGLLYCKCARATKRELIARYERQIESKLKELEKLHEPYIKKVQRLNKEYKELIFNLNEYGKVSLTELDNMTLLKRIEYQNYIVNKLESQANAKHNKA